jgi:hypothetical protein
LMKILRDIKNDQNDKKIILAWLKLLPILICCGREKK